MKITTIRTGSGGNCHLIQNKNGGQIFIELGLTIKEFMREKINLKQVQGALISHLHGDHYNGKLALILQKIFPVYVPDSSGVAGVGDFIVRTFELQHDAACYGFLVSSCGEKLLYICDTGFVSQKFKNIDYLMIEANHDRNSMENCEDCIKKHIQHGHFSIEQAEEFIKNNLLGKIPEEIHLIHMSEHRADPLEFVQRIRQICPTSKVKAWNGGIE